jgi:hypothetical protein
MEHNLCHRQHVADVLQVLKVEVAGEQDDCHPNGEPACSDLLILEDVLEEMFRM